MMRTIGSMLVAISIAVILTPAVAQAKFAPPLGDWGVPHRDHVSQQALADASIHEVSGCGKFSAADLRGARSVFDHRARASIRQFHHGTLYGAQLARCTVSAADTF